MKLKLSFAQILNMNVGFFGIQYSFGLQQSNMSPIYKYLGADEASLPLLWLAGPVTGLIVQPLIGALSDRTLTPWGRRTPYFLIGAILCSICLFFMPFSPSLWMAASVLWILDAANNVTMEPYRAFVADQLPADQLPLGFLTQSAFTGLGQTLAYLTPTLLVLWGMNKDAVNARNIPLITIAAFAIGGIFSITSILWTLKTTRENPLSKVQLAEIQSNPISLGTTLDDIGTALREMPATMKQLAVMKFFQWYALFCYWQFIVSSLSTTLFGTTDAASQGFRDANYLNGQIGAFYNFIAFIAAFGLVPVARRFGPRTTHSVCLLAAGFGMLAIPEIQTPNLLFIPMVGIGLAWASIMGNPYVMLATSIPPARVGVYMGIFNMFIVIPMIVQIVTLPMYYQAVLHGNPENVIRLAGVLMLGAAAATLLVKPSASS
jgi:maltose/moltooligosaccharide transporter